MVLIIQCGTPASRWDLITSTHGRIRMTLANGRWRGEVWETKDAAYVFTTNSDGIWDDALPCRGWPVSAIPALMQDLLDSAIST